MKVYTLHYSNMSLIGHSVYASVKAAQKAIGVATMWQRDVGGETSCVWEGYIQPLGCRGFTQPLGCRGFTQRSYYIIEREVVS